MSTGTSCHFGHLLQVSNKFLWSLILYNFFHHFIHVYSPRAGADSPRWQNFDVNRNVLSLNSFVASLKKHVFEVWFYIFFFHALIHVYSPRAGEDVFEVWFYTIFFHDFIHVYSHRAGGIQPPGDKVLMSTETSCDFGNLLLVSNDRWQ